MAPDTPLSSPEAWARAARPQSSRPSARPADLVDHLLQRRFTRFEEPVATGMILRRPLPDEASVISTRRPGGGELGHRGAQRVQTNGDPRNARTALGDECVDIERLRVMLGEDALEAPLGLGARGLAGGDG